MKQNNVQNPASNNASVPDHPVIVQFFHSGKEFKVKGGRTGVPVDVPWKLERKVNAKEHRLTGCSVRPSRKKNHECGGCHDDKGDEVWTADHSRRLVVHNGDYVNKEGKLVSGDLAFWTEWEACTIAAPMPKGKNETDARWFHKVVTPSRKTGDHRVNTDPCVFGSSFKYALCQQHSKAETRDDSVVLRRLPSGSIILFGSRFLKRNEFVLDTVFVVGDIRTHYTEQTKKEMEVSDEYRALTLNRFSNESLENTFYRGESFSSSGGAKPYSFVPARPFVQGDARCGKRFVLDLASVNTHLRTTKNEFKPTSEKTQGFQRIEASSRIVNSVWREIVRQVRKQGFVLGVRFDWPK